MALPRAAQGAGVDPAVVRSFRRPSGAGRVGGARRADRRCLDRSRADPAQQPQENRRIKAGEEIEAWGEPKRRQTDTDARWTKQHGKSDFGYKKHIDVDTEHKLIRDYEATAASVHDSQLFDDIDPDNADPQVWAEAAQRAASASNGCRLATIFPAIEHVQCLTSAFVADL